MLQTRIVFAIFLILEMVNCELLIWSTKELRFPALKHYKTEDFRRVLSDLGNPKIAIFNEFSQDFMEREYNLLKKIERKEAFMLNADVNFEEFDVIAPNNSEDILKWNGDILFVFQRKQPRIKREVASEVAESENSSSVLFADSGIMIYSKRAPELRRESTTILLSQCSSITSQTSSNHTLIITIEFFVSDQTTVGLIFYFVVMQRTWLLQGTKLNDAAGDMVLKPSQKVFAPLDFSFHCNEIITFRDLENDIEVKFYNMQVQPYSASERVFFPAVDCVSHFTIPILCCLLVIGVFLFGVFLGLAALASIKPIQLFEGGKVKKFNVKHE